MKTLDVTNPIHRSLLRRGFFLIGVALVVHAAPVTAQDNGVTNWNRSRQHARCVPCCGGRSSECPPGQHGDDAGCRLRRGQRDRATASAVPYSRRTSTQGPRRRPLRRPRRTPSSLTSSRRYPRPSHSQTRPPCCSPSPRHIRSRLQREPSPWVPNYEPGHWQPLLNPNGTQMLDPTAWVANVRPFLIKSTIAVPYRRPKRAHQHRVRGGLQRGQGDRLREQHDSHAEQTHIAIFWQTPQPWNAVARNLIADPKYAVDIVDSALLFAMLNLSAADAAINCWNDRFLLELVAAMDSDPAGGQGRQSGDRARPVVDGAHHRAVPRPPVWAPVAR